MFNERKNFIIKHLREKDKSKVQTPSITLRDFIVITQPGGEFIEIIPGKDLPHLANSHLSLEELRIESDAKVIERVTKQINIIAARIKKIHLQNNFDNAANFMSEENLRQLALKRIAARYQSTSSERVARLYADYEADIKKFKPSSANFQEAIQALRLKHGNKDYPHKIIEAHAITKNILDKTMLYIREIKLSGMHDNYEKDIQNFNPSQLDIEDAARSQLYPELDPQARAIKIYSQTRLDSYLQEQIHSIINELTITNKNAVMRANNVNSITRVTTQEFTFYPYKERGPFSLEMFSDLIVAVEKIAKDCPPNMHMTLASFPVVDSQRLLRNVVLYVQCDKEPIITSFIKATPSDQDLEYPDTLTPHIHSGSHHHMLVNDLKESLEKINASTSDTSIILNELIKLEKRCESNPDYSTLTWADSQGHTHSIVDITSTCNEVANTLVAKKDKTAAMVRLSELVTDFTAAIVKHGQTFVYYNQRLINVGHVPLSNANLVKTDKEISYYAGYIPFVTAGGKNGLAIVDNCLDHINEIAGVEIEHRINQAIKDASYPISPEVTYSVVSDWVELEPSNIIGEYVVHADSKNPSVVSAAGIQKEVKDVDNNVVTNYSVDQTHNSFSGLGAVEFGLNYKLYGFPLRSIDEINMQWKDKITQHNANVRDIFTARLQYAAEIDKRADLLATIKFDLRQLHKLLNKTTSPLEKNQIEQSIEKLESLEKNYEFLVAVQHNDVVTINNFIRNNFDINCTDFNGDTALHIAIKLHLNAVIDILVITKKINLESPNRDGNTPLLLACMVENSHVVTKLLKLGANPEAINHFEETSLHIIAERGSIPLIKAFINSNKNPQRCDGVTPLYLAVATPGVNKHLIKDLVRLKCDPLVTNAYQETLLHAAAAAGNHHLMSYLSRVFKRHGAPNNFLDQKNGDNETPLHVAVLNGHIKVLNKLLELGADASIADRKGNLPIDLAINLDNRQLIKKLYQYMQDNKSLALYIDHASEHQLNMICSLAAECGDKSILEHLIAKNIDVRKHDKAGLSPIEYAKFQPHHACVQILSVAASKKNSVDNLYQLVEIIQAACHLIGSKSEQDKIAILLNKIKHKFTSALSDDEKINFVIHEINNQLDELILEGRPFAQLHNVLFRPKNKLQKSQQINTELNDYHLIRMLANVLRSFTLQYPNAEFTQKLLADKREFIESVQFGIDLDAKNDVYAQWVPSLAGSMYRQYLEFKIKFNTLSDILSDDLIFNIYQHTSINRSLLMKILNVDEQQSKKLDKLVNVFDEFIHNPNDNNLFDNAVLALSNVTPLLYEHGTYQEKEACKNRGYSFLQAIKDTYHLRLRANAPTTEVLKNL